MSKERQSKAGDPPAKAPFTTLDDLVVQAETLAGGLRRLSETRHPLDIRRGVPLGEEVVDMTEQGDSITVKAGSKTYFFDLKQTRDNKPYLLITESRFKGEGEERERVTISVFPETAEQFSQAVASMAARLGR
jgi:hypothetical protein